VNVPAGDAFRDITWREIQGALDKELDRLPERFRALLVLCYLEDRTRDEAAEQLGCTLGALKGRLKRGRELLRGRLASRGITLSAVLFGKALAEEAASATLPPTLAWAMVKAATGFTAGKVASEALVSAKIFSLVEGVCRTMFLTKLKLATLLLFWGGVLCVGTGLGTLQVLGAGQSAPENQANGPSSRSRQPTFCRRATTSLRPQSCSFQGQSL